MDGATLTDLYVTKRLGDAEIGSRYGVPGWRVKKRRRELGVHRPVGTPPRPAPPDPPPADVLHRWYVDQGRTLEAAQRIASNTAHLLRIEQHSPGLPARLGVHLERICLQLIYI